MQLKEVGMTARRAFTLIEVMVATVVMLILFGLVIQITSHVLNAWHRTSGRLSANAEARIAMDRLTQDLQTAVVRADGLQWLRVEGPLDLAGVHSGQTVALKLFAPTLDRPSNRLGSICAIGYRLAFKASYVQGPKTYALYRKVVDPDRTFHELLGQSKQGELSGGEWSDASILADPNYLAANIIDFNVFIYARDDNTFALNDTNADGRIDGDFVYGGGEAPQAAHGVALSYAEIVLTVISDRGLELLQLLAKGASGSGYSDPADVVREHAKQFTRRVAFPAQPL
jgi:prepilin-type N-terminal cleavage/methylation domain-containing protein